MYFMHAVNETNPAPKAPPGTEGVVSDIMAYVKWGTIILCGIVALCGSGAIAGGKLFGHHKSSQVGIGMVISALGGAAVWSFIIGVVWAISQGGGAA
jgi:hypothetical protein